MYPLELLSRKDKWCKSPIYYLSLNHSPDSITLINNVIQLTVVDQLQWLGLEQWRLDVSNQIDTIHCGEDISVRTTQIGKIYSKLAGYERMEVISLLEQAVWKLKIDEANSTNTIWTGVR